MELKPLWNTECYYLSDHLGSIRVVLTETGGVDSWSDFYPFGKESRGSSTSNEPKEQFTGKERDIEIGLDYFGARYYNADIGRWTTVDPMSNKRPWVSSYNFVQNNPLNRIDIDGQLDDDYKVDKEGKIELIKKTDDDHDVLYATKLEGDPDHAFEVDENNSIKVDKGVLDNIQKGKYGNTEYSFMQMNDEGASKQLFEFLANNSKVEWSQISFGSKSSYLSTSNNRSTELGSADLMYQLLLNKQEVNTYTHSHPSWNSKYGPSDSGDIPNAKWLRENFNKMPKLNIYHVETKTYIPYDDTTINK